MKFKENYKYIRPLEYVDIFSDPQWYLRIENELKEFFYDYDGKRENKTQEWLDHRTEFVKMFHELLESDQIVLGNSGINWDKDRLPIDTIVIHHTSTPSDLPMSAIDALGLIRLYAKIYSQKEEKEYGKPIWSNHFYKGRLTFIAYHYIIKRDGSFEHILNDDQIAWHSGDWNYNCRSVAVCFLDDLKDTRPTDKAIQTAQEIIKKYSHCTILGHREIKPSTTCPGNLFLGNDGWKKKLKIS